MDACRTILNHPRFNAINETDNSGQTALHWARNPDVSAAILAHPNFSSINTRDDHGKTALHLASRNINMLRLLLDQRADPNLLDGCGRTALHSAGCVEVCEALLSAGVDANLCDRDGRTALHYSCNGAVAQSILAHPQFTLAERRDGNDGSGHTALCTAARYGRGEVMLAILRAGVTVSPEEALEAVRCTGPVSQVQWARLQRYPDGSLEEAIASLQPLADQAIVVSGPGEGVSDAAETLQVAHETSTGLSALFCKWSWPWLRR